VGLKQLDAITRWIVEQYLLATSANHDVISEPSTSFTKCINQALQVVHLKLDAIPSTRFGTPPVGHGLSRASPSARRAEQQPKVTANKHGESQRRLHCCVEAKMLGVEGHGGFHVVDDVTYIH
jgi:hypothetical protein